ncbi:cytochrome P450 [Actinoplanes sp. NPDC049265]|uniref:cytochrome P450 n=1 Tax=Actinoplanes sp. NPDC049265 TaxID=3363902 RepID=UPI003713D3A4
MERISVYGRQIPRRRVVYNPATAEFQQNPFPGLRALREQDPVHLTPRGWVLTRYDDCAEVLSSRQFGMRGIEGMLRRQIGPGPAFEVIARRFHSYDPPEHTRLRSLVAKAFAGPRLDRMRGQIEALADRLLHHAGEPSFDLVEKFASPLPSAVIAAMLGTPPRDRARLNGWTDRILDLQGMARPGSATLAQGNAAARDYRAYLRAFVEARRREPGDDLVSTLIEAQEQGHRLTDAEIADCALFLANAGSATTRNLIANAVNALQSDRTQWELLVDDPALIGPAVAEALRFDCSLTSTPRFAQQEAVIGNRRVAAGAAVFCQLNAANRDPARFPDPDRFDITRADKKHLAFGGGVHFCLGARLAHLQGELALRALLRHHPTLRLATERIEWRSGLYRGPLRLPVVTA